MKKIWLLLAVSAVLVVLLSSAALADQHLAGMTASPTATTTATASPTATATTAATAQYAQYATATATPLAPTGGPSLAVPVALVAALALVGSGVAALVFVRRSVGYKR
jgi:hypothetical protein